MHWDTGFETSISGGPRADSAQLVTLRQNWDRAPKDGNEYVRDYPQKKQQYSGFASVVGWSASLTLPDYGRFARHPARISGERQWKSLFAALQYSRRAFSFHFATLTPFTMSHRQSDNSPIRASTRMRKIFPAYAGARMSVKLFAR